jgi:hypothetical protein
VRALSLLVFSSLAWAGAQRISLEGISGPGGARFADQLLDDLAEVYEVVLAGEPADAVIRGAIVGEGEERRLRMVVRKNGRVVERNEYDIGTTSLPLVRDRVLRDLVRAFERSEVPPPAEAEPAVEENAVVRTARPQEPPHGVFAGVGPTLLTRFLNFDVPAYSGGIVGGIRADGAVFPLALSAELAQAHPVLASFGLVGSYEHIFTFSANGTPGSASHWLALLVGRVPLGKRGGTLQIESGYQELVWRHESELDARVPDVQYQSIDLGLGWDRPLGSKRLVGALRLAYLALIAAGDITSDSQYGSATGWGVELEAAVTYSPLSWLWLRLGARYNAFGLSFARNGTHFARSSLDQLVGGLVEVGFAL